LRILYVADAAPVNVVAEGLVRGLRMAGHEVLAYGPGLDAFYGFEVSLRRALDLLNWRGPRFYPDLIWYSDARFQPDWDGLECPRILTWVSPNSFDASEMVKAADAVFIFRKQYLESVQELNANTLWMPFGVDDSVFYPDLTVPKAYRVICSGFPPEDDREPWRRLQRKVGTRMVSIGERWGEDRAQAYRAAEVVIDWHEHSLLSDTTVMAMACGACTCANAVPGLLDAFEMNKHLVTYEPGTICELVEALLVDTPRRQSIAAEGCKQVLYRHSWRQRVGEMIAYLDKRKIVAHAVKLPSVLLPAATEE